MSKQYNIRWKSADDAELRKAVKNFNAKITRLEKKGVDESLLPERASVATIRDLVATRQDLKRELNSLKRFSKRGAEEITTIPNTQYNIQTTKWQKEDMEIRSRAITNRRRNRLKEIENFEMESGGKKLGYTRGQFGMGQAEKISLKPIKPFYRTMSQGDIKKRHKHFQRESQSNYFNKKDEELRSNFIRGLEQTYGKDKVADIVDSVSDMDFKEFYQKFQSEPGMMEFASDIPEDADEQGYLAKLRSTWLPNKKGGKK